MQGHGFAAAIAFFAGKELYDPPDLCAPVVENKR
jgi:hypothetical protein